MTAKQRIEAELDRIGLASGAGSLQVALDGGDLAAELTAVNALACAFERFAFLASALDHAPLDRLDRVAADLSSRLSYLLESISPIEKDKDGCVVQMRSNPPQKDDDGTSYYELLVRRGELSLCRYAKASGQPRRSIPAQVTREVFCRLAADFETAAKTR